MSQYTLSRGTLATAALLLIITPLAAQTPRNVVPAPGTTSIVTLSQNWTDAEAVQFYGTPQGSKLIPYAWFLALEQKGNTALFKEQGNIQRLGYLARSASTENSDGLPVGFTRDGDHVGFTCAACHTQQITFNNTTYLIDGAPTLADLEQFLRALADSMQDTLDDAAKFKRFADAVLGAGATDAQRGDLKAKFTDVLSLRKNYNIRNLSLQNDVRPAFGPGRVDAIGSIFNEVSTLGAKLPDNYRPTDAPVSYPFLWDTPQHDKVQWNGSVDNTVNVLAQPIFGTKHIGALGRNAGEVLGVFGTFEVVKDGILPRGYPSSVNLPKLIQLEDSLRKLWSPQWPAAFGPIDEPKRAAGESLYRTYCVECHQPIVRTSEQREVTAWLKRSIGTDPNMARNFLTRQVKTGQFKGQYIKVPGLSTFKDQAASAELLVHSVTRVLIGGGRDASFEVPFSVAAPADIFVDNDPNGRRLTGRFHALELEKDKLVAGVFDPRSSVNELQLNAGKKTFKMTHSANAADRFLAHDGTTLRLDALTTEADTTANTARLQFKRAVSVGYIYKGRPLNGVWATAPFLHNGSVPNLDELLKKPSARVKKFEVGSREFDKDKVGFKSEIGTGTFSIDTLLPGNSNDGHDYGDKEFSDDERKALIEYIKSL